MHVLRTHLTIAATMLTVAATMLPLARGKSLSKVAQKTVQRQFSYPALHPGKFLYEVKMRDKLQEMLHKIGYCFGTEQQLTIQKSCWVNWFRIRFGYTSNALEGNSLNEGDVIQLIEKGITVRGKPLRDVLDIGAHDNAIKMLFALASSEAPLTVDLIKSLHMAALPAPVRESDPPLGQYKRTPNMTFTSSINGKYAVQRFVDPEDVRDRMAELVFWLRDHEKEVHPLYLATVSHYNLATIHPFPDGNGRVARLLMNLMLLCRSFMPAIIEVHQQEDYLTALQTARQTQDLTPFMEFITQTMLSTQEAFLQLCENVHKK